MKERKDIITHIAIITVILIILIISVYKLVKWNQGSPDSGAVETTEDFDTEPEDYITAVNPDLLKGRKDDGITTIVFLGDQVLADYQGADSIPGQVASLMGSDKTKVYNCGFSGMNLSAASPVWEDANSKDAFSLYWLTKSITLNNYDLLNNMADSQPDAGSQLKDTIQTLEGIDFEQVDVITMMYGVNDYLQGSLITDVANPNNIAAYSGALKSSLELLQKTYPHIRIIVMSPTFCLVEQDGKTVNCDVTDTGYGMLADYMVASKSIAVESNITFLDNYYGVRIDAQNYMQYLEDNVLLNEAGRKMVAERLSGLLLKEEKVGAKNK